MCEESEALKYFMKASMLGCGMGLNAVGRWYTKNKQFERAIKCFKLAVKHCNVWSNQDILDIYECNEKQ